MPRIKLTEQPCYEFHHKLSVRVTDLNYGVHLGNDALVSLIHEARVHLFRALGCSEINLGDDKTGLIMGDLVVNFVQEGFLFDEIVIDSHVGAVSRHGFRIFHRMTKAGQLFALAETGLIAFDYKARRVSPLPEEFLAAVRAYQREVVA